MAHKVERMSDAELRAYMAVMSHTVGKYAANEFRRALNEAIKREQVTA